MTRESRAGVTDYTSEEGFEGDTHYNGVPSWFGRHVEMENREQPRYCEPGEAGGALRGEKRNVQSGP